MLLSQTSIKKYLFCYIVVVFLLPQATEAKRYVNAEDGEVSYVINDGSFEHHEIDKSQLKILIWNLYKAQKNSFEEDYKRITKDKDILLLQEVITNEKMKNILESDESRSYHIATSFFDTEDNWTRSGTAIASKYKVSEFSWQRSRSLEPVIKTSKMVSVAKFDIEGSSNQLMTLSIHAVNFVSAAKLEDQISQAVKLIKGHSGPVVFGGDFNTWSKKKLELMRTILLKVGLSEVLFGEGRMETFGFPLDHVFIRDLEVVSSKVYGEVEGSDHKALEVVVSFPN